MNPAQMLRAMLHADPFQPFDVVLTSGRRLHIHHPDYLVIMPAFIVWQGEGTDPDAALVMPMHVVRVEPSPEAGGLTKGRTEHGRAGRN